jgi:hypothetical protein
MADNPNMPIATASTSWQDGNGLHLRVYSTDGYKVSERCYDNNAWTTGGFSANGSEVSVTSWLNGNSASIRVYCTFEDATVEWCQDPGGNWYQGGYTVS